MLLAPSPLNRSPPQTSEASTEKTKSEIYSLNKRNKSILTLAENVIMHVCSWLKKRF